MMQVYSCFLTVHMDKENFEDPKAFRPERFIDNETGEFAKSEKIVAFGVGKRRCPGELLATSEYFIFLASLVQKFDMRAVEPVDFSTVPGHGFTPVPFKVNFVQRN